MNQFILDRKLYCSHFLALSDLETGEVIHLAGKSLFCPAAGQRVGGRRRVPPGTLGPAGALTGAFPDQPFQPGLLAAEAPGDGLGHQTGANHLPGARPGSPIWRRWSPRAEAQFPTGEPGE